MLIYYIAFLVFLSVSLLTFGLYRYFSLDKRSERGLNERLEAIRKSDNADIALELQRNRRGLWLLQKNNRLLELNKWFVQTGLDLDRVFAVKVSLFVLVASIVGFLSLNFTMFGFFSGFFSSLVAIYFFLKRCRSKRIAKFEAQLPDALDIVVRSLRAGHPTQTALSLVARECTDPLGSEFGYVADEIRHGLDISSALRNLADRVGLPDLIYVEAAISVQSQSGGSLSIVIANLSKIIRERFKLKQKIAALTSEGRISGIVLTVLPVAIAAVVMLLNPSYYLDVFWDPTFTNGIILSVTLLILGHLWIQSLLRFRN